MLVDARQLPAHLHTTIPEEMYYREPFSLATVATLVSIALSIFLLRVYTRTRLLRFFGIDDCLMLVSVVSILMHASVQEEADGRIALRVGSPSYVRSARSRWFRRAKRCDAS